MDINTLQEIAERYGLIIAETEEEAKKFEELGYHKLEWDLERVIPEIFDKRWWIRSTTEQVETEAGMEWIARFPDVGNTGGGGDTKEEAIQDAAENLKFHLSMLEKRVRVDKSDRLYCADCKHLITDFPKTAMGQCNKYNESLDFCDWFYRCDQCLEEFEKYQDVKD